MLAAPAIARAQFPQRLVTLDYGVAQTLIEIGRPPVAMAATDEWAQWCVEPPLPAGVVNLGTSREPNLEILQQLRPDLILTTPFLERLRPKLARVGPTESLVIHALDAPPWAAIVDATRALGGRLGAVREAEALIARADALVAEAAVRVAPLRDRPILLAAFQDARHVWVYGRNGIFDETLSRLGLVNGWTGRTNAWGFASVGVEALASASEARLACLDPTPADALALLDRSPIWRATGFAEPGRLLRLPATLAFGMLPSATRLARLLGEAATRV
ncbi:ABC transporter substrate-binding protein [Methylopila sp. M107]|uniref:ABC transporter substrate-binding protein n=1 Tax=Methylopila sp. M107 TaxID=1101190 RepID=UPI00037706AF|nr:ABC transporter substrate-binding protein [Methylopila sp. M107]